MNTEIKVLSLNVRGLNKDTKRKSLYRWINENKFDISLLQETFCTKYSLKKFNWSGDIFHSLSNSSHSRGVAILLGKNMTYKVHSSHNDDFGRMLLLNIEINNKLYTIVNIYAPNTISERVLFFKQLDIFINTYALNKTHLMIGGDFNCTVEQRDRASGVLDNSSTELKSFFGVNNVVDVWRALHPGDISFTYIDPSCQNKSSRIDLVLSTIPVVVSIS